MKVFDSHFHVIDRRFPLVANNGYLPEDFDALQYQKSVEGMNIEGGAIVSGSFQAFDQSYLLDALKTLGPNFVGVANIALGTSDKVLNELNTAGVKAVRFNLKRGGSEELKNMVRLSNELYDKYNWHTELYVDCATVDDIKPTLVQLPKFSIDHLGLTTEGLACLYFWVERGVKVKATGFGRVDFDVLEVLRTIHRIDNKALMFGTDLPSTRAKRPFMKSDLDLIKDNFESKEVENIMWNNAYSWYMDR